MASFYTNNDTRQIVDKVTNDVYQLVCSTMGPDGKLIAIQKDRLMHLTKDGVTVAKSIEYDDTAYNIVSRMITEASVETDNICGDGTTTTVFLTNHLYNAFKHNFGFKVQRRLDKLIEETADIVTDYIHNCSIDDELLRLVALTTSNNDEDIVNKVLDIYKTSEAEPYIDVIEGSTNDDIIEKHSGITISGGYAHPSFSPNGTGNAIKLNVPYVPVVIDKDINTISCPNIGEELETLEKALENSKHPIFIFCRSMDNGVCNAIGTINGKHFKKLREHNPEAVINTYICVVRVDAQGSIGTGIMSDVAMLTNGDLYPEFNTEIIDFNKVSKTPIIITSSTIELTEVSDKLHKEILKQVANIDESIKALGATKQDSVIARILKHRKRSLIGGRVTIAVGGKVRSDIIERKDRFTDVIMAVKSALNGGVIPGCGFVLLEAGKELLKRYPEDELVEKLAYVFSRQYCYLMDYDTNPYEDYDSLEYHNLATGEVGSNPKAIEVYDTAAALLSALKAGYKTSTLLINLSGILLGNALTRQEIKIG